MSRCIATDSRRSQQTLPLLVIPSAGLHHVVLLLHRDVQLVIAPAGTRVRRVTQAVLAAQLVFDLVIYLVDRLLLGNLEPAGQISIGSPVAATAGPSIPCNEAFGGKNGSCDSSLGSAHFHRGFRPLHRFASQAHGCPKYNPGKPQNGV